MGRGAGSLVIACDYDRTLTDDDLRINRAAAEAIADLKRSIGFAFIIVSGRRLEELLEIEELRPLCDVYVAENGAVIYDARGGDKIILARRQDSLDAALEEARIEAEKGDVIISVKGKLYGRLREALERHSGDVATIFNRDSVMILPKGIDKGRGLRRAVGILGLDDPYIVAFGDGENDVDLFKAAHLGVAVSNAADELKRAADVVSELPDGDAVLDYILKSVRRS